MKKRLLIGLLLVCICVTMIPSCAQKKDRSHSYFLMDTVITVTLFETDDKAAEEVFARCHAILSELEHLWARQKPDSDVARFNASSNGAIAIDARTHALIEKAIAVYQATNGSFDITVAPLVDLWKLAGDANKLPTDTEFAEALSLVGSNRLCFENGLLCKQDAAVAIDLGGIGKGAAIEYLIDYLEGCDLQGGLVSFGSNVAVFGEKKDGSPFKIGIQDPKNPNGTVATVYLQSGEILSVSGDYERYVTVEGRNYHHILAPSTGYPAESGLSSVAVIARDGALADALSTALFVMGTERAMAFYASHTYAFEAILVGNDSSVIKTAGLASA